MVATEAKNVTKAERDLGRRWFDEVWNQGRRESIGEMIAPDAVLHEGGADSRGPDGFYPFFDRMIATFSEIRVNVEDTLAEDDKLCVRWSFSGKHTGNGLGIPPTGKTVNVTGISILRVAGAMLLEGWQNWDMLGLMEQLKDVRPSPTYVAAL
jgi:predicted ester cyclase